MRDLTARQKMFVDEYVRLRCTNATKAAINAGYSEKTAGTIACENLKKPKILEFLERRKNEIRDEIQRGFMFDALTAREVMQSILANPEATDKNKITVARDFLDRAGFGATEKVDATVSAMLAGQVAVTKDPYEGLTTEELQKLLKLVEADEQKT